MPILHSDHSVYRMFTRGKNLFLRSMGSMAWHYLGSPKKSHPNVGKTMLVGGFNHLEKYESQLGLSFQIRKIKNVPNHQSECHKKEYMVSTNLFHNLKKNICFRIRFNMVMTGGCCKWHCFTHINQIFIHYWNGVYHLFISIYGEIGMI